MDLAYQLFDGLLALRRTPQEEAHMSQYQRIGDRPTIVLPARRWMEISVQGGQLRLVYRFRDQGAGRFETCADGGAQHDG
jgi:hypothetical protein